MTFGILFRARSQTLLAADATRLGAVPGTTAVLYTSAKVGRNDVGDERPGPKRVRRERGGRVPRVVANPVARRLDTYLRESDSPSPLAWLLLPVKAVVDGFVAEHPDDDRMVLMVGRPGGGWTTYLSGALDPRIDVAGSVAGGSPSSQRLLDAQADGFRRGTRSRWTPTH